MLEENTIAPNFTLKNQDGKDVSLSDYAGKWTLIYFYPKDDTPGCTKEACALRDNFPFYEDTGIEILGISKDSPASHTKFIQKYSLPFTLLSDSEGSVAKTYRANGMLGTKRISYLVSPNGTIAKSYPKVSPATHAQEVLEDLKKLQG